MMRVAVCLALSWGLGVATPIRAQEPSPERDRTEQSALEPAVDTSAGQEAPLTQPSPPRAGERVPKAGEGDRLELDATQITGNRELPKVLYIVPWKRSDLGDLVGKPAGSLLDEVLAPVDRDVFRRENRYYRALQPDDPDAAGTRPAVEPPAGDES